MIVLNFGIPRSGTVWAFNVFRQIWERRQVPFRTANPISGSDVEECVNSLDPAENVIVHGHNLTPSLIRLAKERDVRPFFNYRDPRDVVVSQIRLHDISCERAIEQTANSFRQFTVALGLPGIVIIPYAHILEHPEALIFQMATRMGVLLKFDEIQAIARDTSTDRHRQIMAGVQTATDSEAGIATAQLEQRSIRYDQHRLITDRHIQSGKCGRWRDELDPVEQQMVKERFAPLVKVLGFDAA